MAKIKLRIPLEQFQFIEVELEDTSPEKTAEIYREYQEAFKPVSGLTAKELDLIVEKMCLGKTVEGGTELWAKATQAQKDQINCLKRALSRIKAKHSKKSVDDYAEDALSDIG